MSVMWEKTGLTSSDGAFVYCLSKKYEVKIRPSLLKILGIDQPQVSRLKNADFTRFSVERLFSLLNKLGRDVEIRINGLFMRKIP